MYPLWASIKRTVPASEEHGEGPPGRTLRASAQVIPEREGAGVGGFSRPKDRVGCMMRLLFLVITRFLEEMGGESAFREELTIRPRGQDDSSHKFDSTVHGALRARHRLR